MPKSHLKEVPNVPIPKRYAMKASDGMSDAQKANIAFCNGELSVEELTQRLKKHILAKNII